jgi:mRNA-degrading endonuclease toxin of MazEF toxin-antitoxin module
MDELRKISKYVKGQVWWLHVDREFTNKELEKGSSILVKTRPVVIVSSNDGNNSSGILKVAPVTHGGNPELSVNVPFTNLDGEACVIECNQSKPVSNKDIISNSYQYTLPDSVMSQVEIGILISYGLSKYLKNKDIDFGQLKMIIDKMAKSKSEEINENYKTVTQETVDKIASGLEDIFSFALKNQENPHNTIVEAATKSAPKFTKFIQSEPARKQQQQEVPVTNSNSDSHEELTKHISTSKPRGYWTEGRMRDFVSDKESMPISEVAKKWDIDNPKTVCQYYYTFKGKIK